ncbi:MAG: PilZ domain-containing protein [Planctomycetota bacterium]
MRSQPIRTGRHSASRRWTRWTAQVPLEVCGDPKDRSIPWSATLHNASEGGLAFWSKQAFLTGSPIYVREFMPESQPGWMPARVVHYVSDLRGFLVGIAFDRPRSAQFVWSVCGRSIRPATAE